MWVINVLVSLIARLYVSVGKTNSQSLNFEHRLLRYIRKYRKMVYELNREFYVPDFQKRNKLSQKISFGIRTGGVHLVLLAGTSVL